MARMSLTMAPPRWSSATLSGERQLPYGRTSAVTARRWVSRRLHQLKLLGVAILGEPVGTRCGPHPVAHAAIQLVPVVVLAAVLTQGLHLTIDGRGDVDDLVALGDRHHPYLGDGVRFQALVVEQLGMR